jgi:hypothetical protein
LIAAFIARRHARKVTGIRSFCYKRQRSRDRTWHLSRQRHHGPLPGSWGPWHNDATV